LARGSGTPHPTPEETFATRTRPEGDCLLWTGRRTSGLKTPPCYGLLVVNGKRTLAHRYALLRLGLVIPPGMQVNHRCGVSLCVRADHLYIGTQAENMRDLYHPERLD